MSRIGIISSRCVVHYAVSQLSGRRILQYGLRSRTAGTSKHVGDSASSQRVHRVWITGERYYGGETGTGTMTGCRNISKPKSGRQQCISS